MAQMQALLKIKADVTGENKVQGLATKLGGLGSVASKVGGGLKGLAGAAGGLGGALGALVPAVSVAGLAAMAKGAIDTADNLAKMSAKTGVSVEQLSKFKQAADLGGTSIEAVTGAMLKLNKGLAEGSGPASKALNTLGISATDASGKLKSTDKIMLEVADKFKAMPDGAEKSALAMQLFGKSGAEMIPMLNGGSKAIDGLNASMSTKFAKSAEAFNDKITTIQAKLMELGVKLGEALMPAFNAVTDAVGVFVDLIGNLPGPVQGVLLGVVALTAAFVLLAPAISAVISIGGALAGLQLGATIAGWLGAIGPAIAGITAAFSGLLAWIGTTLIPGLLAFFSGPVGWTVLAVAAVVAMCIAFREPITQFFAWMGEAIGNGLQALWKWGEPIRQFWTGIWQAIITTANSVFLQPFQTLWTNAQQFVSNFGTWASTALSSTWKSMADGAKNAFRGILQSVANAVNGVSALINRLISAFNRLPGPDIPLIPPLNVPAFADGGVVRGPTLAMVGEGGEPEYIIPQSKMAKASMNFLAGARGGAVIPRFAEGGVVVPGNAQVSIQTGPVTQMNGTNYVTTQDLSRAVQAGVQQTLNMMRNDRGTRRAVGLA
jgi:hypothetical protein